MCDTSHTNCVYTENVVVVVVDIILLNGQKIELTINIIISNESNDREMERALFCRTQK